MMIPEHVTTNPPPSVLASSGIAALQATEMGVFHYLRNGRRRKLIMVIPVVKRPTVASLLILPG